MNGSTIAALACLLLAGGCFAATARLHAGPTVTSDGRVDVQAGLAIGFGYAFANHAAVTGSVGVASGSRNALELTDTIEYVSLPEDAIGRRIGITAQVAMIGEHTGTYVHLGGLHPLRHRSRSGGHEKGFSSRSTTVLALGARARFGLMRDHEDHVLHLAAGGDVTLDLWALSRWR